MEYRRLPHGSELISTVGLGLGNIHNAENGEIGAALTYAVEHGVTIFDLCCGNVGVYKTFGEAVSGSRKKIYTQMHFGAVYDSGAYGFSRELDAVKRSFDRVLTAAKLGYTYFGYVHCIDEESDFREVMDGGLWEHMCSLKRQGVIKHLGFSTHTPAMANKFLDTGMVDMFMFSTNPAFDYSVGDYASGSGGERRELYARAEKLGVGITVMKPFAGGQLLDARRSPLNIALSREQCIKYALDRPAVLSCLPGVGSLGDVKDALAYYDASPEARDYSVLGKAAPSEARGRCVYCDHCVPCPAGIDIGLVNKYYDLAKLGDEMAASHYRKLSTGADACIECGHCESRCPFGVKQMSRMAEIKKHFAE